MSRLRKSSQQKGQNPQDIHEWVTLLHQAKDALNLSEGEFKKLLYNTSLQTEKETDGTEQAGTTARGSHLDKVLDGSTVPQLEFVLRLFLGIYGQGDESRVGHRPNEMQTWLLHWLAAELEHVKWTNKSYTRQLSDEFYGKWVQAAHDLKKHLIEQKLTLRPASSLPTLEMFPKAFSPLVIITGTAQTWPPERIEDLFRYNALFNDLMYVGRLALDPAVLVVPDRILIKLEEEERIQLFGNKHIITLGGPNVNVVTREICKSNIFSFTFPDRHKEFDGIFDYLKGSSTLPGSPEKIKVRLSCRGHVSMLYEFLNCPRDVNYNDERFQRRGVAERERKLLRDLANALRDRADNELATYKEIMEIFQPHGRFDPIKLRRNRPPIGEHDFGMITLGPNPWNREKDKEAKNGENRYEYLSITVAGFTELGTAYALKALSIPNYFRDHPLGGFMMITKGQEETEYDRFVEGSFDWDAEVLTPPYTITELQRKMGEQRNKLHSQRAGAIQQRFSADKDGPDNSEEFNKYCDFLDRFGDVRSFV